MKYRPHRGSLSEAMKECVDLADGDALVCHLQATWSATVGVVEIHPYGPFAPSRPNPDERIGWADTWVVTVGGYAVGFTDGPPPGHLTREPWRSPIRIDRKEE